MSLKFTSIPIDNEFFPWLKSASQRAMQTKGAHWVEGLTDDEIKNYENEVGMAFPSVYNFFLKYMNGTELEIDPKREDYEGYSYCLTYYSYPRDLKLVKEKIQEVTAEMLGINPSAMENSYSIPHVMPIVGHRFLVMDHCETNPVLSIHGTDCVVFARSLKDFLLDDIFGNPLEIKKNDFSGIRVPFWLDK